MKRKLFTIAQWTWGLPQTLIGSAVYIANRKHAHFDYKGARVTVWDRDDGLSLGKFIFVPRIQNGANHSACCADVLRDDERTIHGFGNAETHKDAVITVAKEMAEHEFGHSVQSLILGPAYLLLVGAPSILWNRLPYFVKKRKRTGKSYYAPIFERTANKLGRK